MRSNLSLDPSAAFLREGNSERFSKALGSMAGKKKISSSQQERSTIPENLADLETNPRRRDAVILGVYVLLSLLLYSVTSWPFIFPEGRAPRLAGPDAYFHLRHAEMVLEQFPMVARFDPYTNFPYGEHGLNQGLFDVGVAALSLVTPFSLTTILIWVSPLLVAAVGVWGYLWLSRATNWRCGTLFLLFYTLYPGALTSMASFGQGDHHAAELLLALAVMWSLDKLLRPETHWKWAPLAVLPLFLFYLSWAGTSLHLALVGAVFYVRAWKPDEGLWRKGSLYGASLLVALLLVHYALPWAVIWNVSESVFFMGSSMLALGYPLLVYVAKRPWRSRALVAVLTLAAPFLVALLIPTTRTLLVTLLESRTQQIAEHVVVSGTQLMLWYGPIWMIALVAPVLLWYRQTLWPAMVPLVYGGGLVFFWYQTRDFSYYASPLLAAAAAYVLQSFFQGRTLVALGLICVAPALLLPKETVARPWMTLPMIRETMLLTDGLEEAGTWLKGVNGEVKPTDPEAFGLVAPWDLGNILAQATRVPVAWSQTASPELARLLYSDNPDAVYSALTDNDRRLRYILLPARNIAEKFLGEMYAANLPLGEMYSNSRTVTAGNVTMGLIEPTPRNLSSLLVRLYWDLANGLGHYRLVYETPTQAILATKLLPQTGKLEFHSFPLTKSNAEIFEVLLSNPKTPYNTSRGWLVDAKKAPEVRLFEAVPGALVVGQASPGASVRATIELYSPSRDTSWKNTYKVNADQSGRFQLRLPYPTDEPIASLPGTIEVRGPYELKLDNKTQELSVKESDIREGKTVEL